MRTDRWFSPHFSVLSEFRVRRWTVEVSCPRATQPVCPACWLDTPDRSAASTFREVQSIRDMYREELETVPPDIVPALRSAFWSGVLVLKLVC